MSSITKQQRTCASGLSLAASVMLAQAASSPTCCAISREANSYQVNQASEYRATRSASELHLPRSLFQTGCKEADIRKLLTRLMPRLLMGGDFGQ